jgi:hypothetical protein
MATTPSWPIRLVRVLIAAAFVAVAAWYSPLVTAANWHLFHPRGWVNYRGLHVLVPWPWTADTEANNADPSVTPEGLSLKKMPYTMDRRLPTQSLFVTVITPDAGLTAAEQTGAWMETFRATHPGAAFNDQVLAAIPAGASCLSARSHWNQHGVVWTCISVAGGWVADFEGHDADAAVFFRVVSNLKR